MSIKKFVSSCTITFKTFDFDIAITKDRSILWHFSATSPKKDKRYVVMCIPKMDQGRALVKSALKKVPSGKRFVVVCDYYSEDDLIEADKKNYTLVTLKDINDYGMKMIEIKSMESIQTAA